MLGPGLETRLPAQCVSLCPVDCITVNPDHVEDRETLQQKYLNLVQVADGVNQGGHGGTQNQ
jgi:hypothetical protein